MPAKSCRGISILQLPRSRQPARIRWAVHAARSFASPASSILIDVPPHTSERLPLGTDPPFRHREIQHHAQAYCAILTMLG